MPLIGTEQVARSLDQSKELAVAPVYLASETERGAQRVIAPLTDEHGWSFQRIGNEDSILDSPCRLVRIAHLPSRARRAAAWIINAAPNPMGNPIWQAAFDHGTPPELVAAVTNRLATDLASGSRRALSGDRGPHLAIDRLERAGWAHFRNPHGTGRALSLAELWDHDLLYTSPDALAAVRRRVHVGSPEYELASGTKAWEITVGTSIAWPAAGELWRATFTSGTPAHLVGEFTAALTSPRPVFRDQADLRPELAAHLITTANFTRTASDRAKAARTTTTTASPPSPALDVPRTPPPDAGPKRTR